MMTREEAIKKIAQRGLTKEELENFIKLAKKILNARPRANKELQKAIKSIQALPISPEEKSKLISQVKSQFNAVDDLEQYKKASWVLSQLSVLVKALEEAGE